MSGHIGRLVARRGIAALVSMSCLFVATVEAQPRDPEAVFEQVSRLDDKGDYRGVIQTLLVFLEQPLEPGVRARALQRLAAARIELGEPRAALPSLDEAVNLATTLQDTALLARLDITVANAWLYQGQPLRAARQLQQMLERATTLGDRALQREAYFNLSRAHQELEDWARVLDYSQRAFELADAPTLPDRYRYLALRGIAAYELRDRARAVESFEGLLSIARERSNLREESFALGELGLVAWTVDRDRQAAIDLYERAIAAARRVGVRSLEVSWLSNLGNVHRDSREYDRALASYRSAQRIEADSGQSRVTPTLLKNVGQVLAAMGNRAAAEPALREALAAADERRVPRIRWQARMELADLLAGDNPSEADQLFRECLDILEAHQSSALLESFSVGLLGFALEKYDPYDRYIRFLIDRHEPWKAFAIAERARARVFLDTLTTARDGLAATIPAEYVDVERELLQHVTTIQAQLRQGGLDASARGSATAELGQTEERLTAHRLRLATIAPAAADVRYPRLLDVDHLQKEVLRSGEVLAMFYLGREVSAMWIVRANGREMVRLPSRLTIDSAVRRLLPTLQSPRATVDAETARWLSQTLVRPLLPHIRDGERLIVVPHLALHHLPLEVLEANGRYLVERYPVSYAPSVSSLAYLRRRERKAPDPPTVIAVSGSAPAEGAQSRDVTWASLKPLPHSAGEARRIAELFRPHGTALIGAGASETDLSSAGIDRAAVVHFATHAVIDEVSPERSALALSPGPASDGILQMREVYHLRLNASLVTLSACQTALGQHATGEGIIGLARAFFYAGSGAVTASLWNVNDDSAADFMTRFYESLRRGRPIDRALAEAKVAFLAEGTQWRHPYYWAPFVVSGDASIPLPLVDDRPLLTWWLPGAVAAALAFVLIARARQRGTAAMARG